MMMIRFVWFFANFWSRIAQILIFYFPGKCKYSLDLRSSLFLAEYLCVHVLHYMRVETGGMYAFGPPRSGDELVPSDVSHWLFPTEQYLGPTKVGTQIFFTVQKIHETRQWAPSVLLEFVDCRTIQIKSARGWFSNRVDHVKQLIL